MEHGARPSTRAPVHRRVRLFAESRRLFGYYSPREERVGARRVHRAPRVHRLGARVDQTPLAFLLDHLAPPAQRPPRPLSTPPVRHPRRVVAQFTSNGVRVRRDGSIRRVGPRQPPPPAEGLATVPVAHARLAHARELEIVRLRVAPFPRRRERESVPIAKHAREEHRPRGAVPNGDADGDPRHLSPPPLAREGACFGLETPGAELGATGAETGVETVRERRNLRTTNLSHAIPLGGSFAVPVAPRADAFALDPLGAVTRHRGRRLVNKFGRGVGGRDREFPSGDDVGDDGPIIVAPTPTRAVTSRATHAQIHRPLDALRAPPSPRRPRRDGTPRAQRGAASVRDRFVPTTPHIRERRREEFAM